MIAPAERLERRARLLVHWYPASWRERYGDEFCALLEAELAERPHSVRRALDVARSGLLARAGATGLAGTPLALDRQAPASLAWLTASLGAFLALGVALWSQLLVGMQWVAPGTPDTTAGTLVMSLGVIVLAVVGATALVPVLARVLLGLGRAGGGRLVLPVLVTAVSTAVLVIGARRFENGWPGTGGHHAWPNQGLIPGGVAAFLWAATLSITSYWAHPGALGHFPVNEVHWMAASPLAIIGLVGGGATTLRRLELSARLATFELRCARIAVAAMSVTLVGAVLWLTDTAPRPRSVPENLFHVGAIDLAAGGAMAIALLVALRAVGRGLASLRVAG
jgi:hypothetical protein